MKTRIVLYGALREADPRGYVELTVPAGSTIADLREALRAHLAEQATTVPATLIQRSVFASTDEILYDPRPVPADAELAILPPVSGG
jgi:molybdopterin converting factor small subunit